MTSKGPLTVAFTGPLTGSMTVPLSESARELVTLNMDFARKLARRFFYERNFCGLGLDDFESAGFYGLCEAALRYTPERNPNFRLYAHCRIQGAMQDMMRHCGFITRKQLRAQVIFAGPDGKAGDQLATSAAGLGTLSEVIFESGIQLQVDHRRQVTDLSYTQAHDPEALSIRRDDAAYLQRLLFELPEREQRVLWLKYYEGQTFEEMRDQFEGATRSWLCRIHSRALSMLRKKLDARESHCRTRLALS